MSKRMPYVQKALQSRIYGEDPSIDLNNPDLFQGPAGGPLQKRNNGDNNVQAVSYTHLTLPTILLV